MKYLYAIFVAFLALNTAAAETRVVGNGGDGVVIDGKMYLLDLVERGIEHAPFLDRAKPTPPMLSRMIDLAFARSEFSPALQTIVKAKLSEIYRSRPYLAFMLAKSFGQYDWAVVNRTFQNVDDENTVIDAPLVQVAIRQGKSVFVSRAGFEQMDLGNQAALLFHEVISALAHRQENGDLVSLSYLNRKINSDLFVELTPENWQRLEMDAQNYLDLGDSIYPRPSNPDTVVELKNGFFYNWQHTLKRTFYVGSEFILSYSFSAYDPPESITKGISALCRYYSEYDREGGTIYLPQYSSGLELSRLVMRLREVNAAGKYLSYLETRNDRAKNYQNTGKSSISQSPRDGQDTNCHQMIESNLLKDLTLAGAWKDQEGKNPAEF